MVPKDLELKQEYHGVTDGSLDVEVRSKVGGTLLKRTYTEGQIVQQGDILFEIDPEPFQAALDQAEAKLRTQMAIRTKAENDWVRISGIYKAKFANENDLDQALSNLNQAKASVEQATAEVKAAQINLEYTKVRAPITGVASQATKSDGNLIGTNADASLLTRIIQLDPIYVNFAYPDSERITQQRLLAQGTISMPENNQLKANLRFDDGSYYPLEGKVSFTDSIIEQTGTVNARAVVPNPDHHLLSGQFVIVETSGIVRKNSFIVPPSALMQGSNGIFVYTVGEDNKAAITPVVLGTLIDQGQIIESGIKENDRVIVEGMIKVRPEQLVVVSVDEAKEDKKNESED
jgi:membrane fusion protein (multidrug efflux system)